MLRLKDNEQNKGYNWYALKKKNAQKITQRKNARKAKEKRTRKEELLRVVFRKNAHPKKNARYSFRTRRDTRFARRAT